MFYMNLEFMGETWCHQTDESVKSSLEKFFKLFKGTVVKIMTERYLE